MDILGIILTILLGLFVNSITPKAQLFAAKYSSAYREKRKRNLSRELSFMTSLAENNNKLIAYFFEETMRLLLYAVLFSAIILLILSLQNDAMNAYSNNLPPFERSMRWMIVLLNLEGDSIYTSYFQFVNIFLYVFYVLIAIMVIKINKVIGTARKIQQFDKYRQEVEITLNSGESN